MGGRAMQSIDWRTPAAYSHVKNLPPAGFAWEYLRRNEDYRNDVRRLEQRSTLDEAEMEVFAYRWGVRFPARSRSAA